VASQRSVTFAILGDDDSGNRALNNTANAADRAADSLDRTDAAAAGAGESLDRASGKARNLAEMLATLRDAKVGANISELEYNVERAKEKLKGATGTYRAKLTAEIGELEAQLAVAKSGFKGFEDQGSASAFGIRNSMLAIGGAILATSSEIIGLGAVGLTSFGIIKFGAQGVGDAITLLGQESAQTGMMIDSALGQKVAEAFGKLTKGGQDFAIEVNQLNQGPLRDLQNAAQNGFFEGMAQGLKEAEPEMRAITPLVADFSNRLGSMAKDVIPSLVDLTGKVVDFADESLAALQKAGIVPALQQLMGALGQMFQEMEDSGEADQAMQAIVGTIEVAADVLPPAIRFLTDLSVLMYRVEEPTLAAAKAVGWLLDLLSKLLEMPIGIINTLTGMSSSGTNFNNGSGLSVAGQPLASGGVVTRPGYHLVAEGGQPEAVIPLDRLQAMMNGGAGGQTIVVNVNNAVVGNESQVSAAVRQSLRTTVSRGYGWNSF
jgi:hypothetical protein